MLWDLVLITLVIGVEIPLLLVVFLFIKNPEVSTAKICSKILKVIPLLGLIAIYMGSFNEIEFVHLHNHSDYSLLDGAQRIDQLINTIDDLNMDTVALTEHGNMFSTIPYYKEAKKAGIKPIIGCEVYVATGSRFDKSSCQVADGVIILSSVS